MGGGFGNVAKGSGVEECKFGTVEFEFEQCRVFGGEGGEEEFYGSGSYRMHCQFGNVSLERLKK